MDDLLGLGQQTSSTVFGFESEPVQDAGDDWAKMDIFGGSIAVTNDFAQAPLIEVMSAQTQGKTGTSGLLVKAHFFMKNKVLTLGLEVTNQSGNMHSDFDLKFKRNAFGVHVDGAIRKVQLPQPGQTSSGAVDCCIDKQNVDGKSPPKNPFLVEVAMKTSVDVYFFSVPCYLNCLLSDQAVNSDEAAAFW